MIDQDYVELLNRAPPSAEGLEWTFPTSALASTFTSFLLGTPTICLIIYCIGSEWNGSNGGSSSIKVPTLTRLGMESSSRDTFTAGMHLAAIIAIPLFWCVRLAHRQRLQARTGIAHYDIQSERAIQWVSCAWLMGVIGAVSLFVGASVSGDASSSWSARGIVHSVLLGSAVVGFGGQAACTTRALSKARRVFVVSQRDLISYRRKRWLSYLMVTTGIAAIVSFVLLQRFADKEFGENSEHKCDADWCSSRILAALWQLAFLLEEVAFCAELKHDLAPATAGVGVESFVL